LVTISISCSKSNTDLVATTNTATFSIDGIQYSGQVAAFTSTFCSSDKVVQIVDMDNKNRFFEIDGFKSGTFEDWTSSQCGHLVLSLNLPNDNNAYGSVKSVDANSENITLSGNKYTLTATVRDEYTKTIKHLVTATWTMPQK